MTLWFQVGVRRKVVWGGGVGSQRSGGGWLGISVPSDCALGLPSCG